ncbi:T9SS type A sorting domain-containing protein [Rurimicrobium arvi]
MRKLLALAATCCIFTVNAIAMSGPYTVPSGKLPTLRVAIDSLNLYGMTGAGPVVITLLPGLVTETAPSGGYLLGSAVLNSGPNATSATRTVTIVGNNNNITAASGSGAHDAIFTIQGSDFITVKTLNLFEASSNTTATTQMEHGFSVVKFNSNDGCKTVSFEDCNVTLNNANNTAATGMSHYGTAGFFVGNCTYLSTADLPAPTVYEGSHEGFYMLYDTVVNVNHGVWCKSKQLPADGSAFNDGNFTFRGVCVQNFTHNGMYMINVGNDMVYDCHLYNLEAGGVAPTTNTIVGIFQDGVKTTALHDALLCDQNDINLTVGGTAGNYAIGVYSSLYGNGTTEISRNKIQLATAGSSCGLEGIRVENNLGTLNIHDNVLQSWSNSVATNMPLIGIRNGQIASPYGYAATSIVKNNQFINSTLNTSSYIYGIQDISSTSANPDLEYNTIDNIVLSGNASAFRGISIGQQFVNTANTATILGNIISNIDASAVSTPGIGIRTGSSSLVTAKATANIIKNLKFGTGSLIGIEASYGATALLDKDTIFSLSSGASVYGIQAGYTGYGVGTLNITKSSVHDLSTSATTGSAQGISIAPGTTNVTGTATISANLIYNITASGSGDTAVGISMLGGTATYNVNNNIVSDVTAAGNTSLFSSSFGIASYATGTNNLYYNTVNLKSGSSTATGYGATGMLYNSAGSNKIQNNILRVNVVAGAANNATALRGTAGAPGAAPSLSAFTASSNVYYTPSGSNNYLYVEGTANSGLVNGFHQSGLTANTTKNIVNDPFFNSTCDKSVYHTFMQGTSKTRESATVIENNLSGSAGIYAPSGLSLAEATATDNTVSLDIKDAARGFGSSDIGAVEFAGSQPPAHDILVVSGSGFDTACSANLPFLTGSYPSYYSRTSVQWLRDSTVVPGATTKSIGVTSSTATYILRVYDTVTGCFYYSKPFRMTVVPPPPAVITYYDSLNFCESSAVVVQANKGRGYTYQWKKNGSFIPGETDDHLVISTSGTYQVETNTVLGCPSLSAPIVVRVYPLPDPVVYYVRPRVLGVTQKFYTYQWYRNNVLIPGSDATNALYYVLDDAAYSVAVTDSNGCTAKSEVFLYSLGVSNLNTPGAVRVYPNPVKDMVYVEAGGAAVLSLTDLTGRLVMPAVTADKLDVSGLSDGLYLLHVADKEGRLLQVQKINKVR